VTLITVYTLRYGYTTDASEYHATENHKIFNTKSSANNLIQDAAVPELVYMQNNTVLFLRMKRFIDRSVGAYLFGPPCIS